MARFPFFGGKEPEQPAQPLSANQRFIQNMQKSVNPPEPEPIKKSLFTRKPLKQETPKALFDIFYLGTGARVQLPRYMISYWEIFELCFTSPELRMTIDQIAKESFRNGGEWIPKWKRKCLSCKRIFNRVPHINWYGTKVEGCETCRLPGTMVEPNPEEIEYARWLFEHPNNQETKDISPESIMDLFHQFSWDLDSMDNAFVIMVKEYFWDEDKRRIYAHPKEILRGHPLVMRIVADDRGVRGGKYLSCPAHRDYVLELTSNMYSLPTFGGIESNLQSSGTNPRILSVTDDPPKYCPHCAELGRYVELRQIWYVATEMGGQRPTAFYFSDEVLHLKKHTRGLFYGIPPVLTLYRVVRTLIKMDEYMHEYMERRRIPRGLVMVRRQSALPGLNVAPNELEVDNFKNDLNQRAMNDPHDIPFVGVSGDEVQFLPFADTIKEMDMVNVRTEMRQRIGNFFGVSPIMQGDTSVGGGLNNEGLQITVTNRTVETHQKIFNERLIPFLTTQLGIMNWEYRLKPSEEKDEAHEWDLKLKQDQHMANRKAAGFPVWINDYDEYEYGHEAADTPSVPADGDGPEAGQPSQPGQSEEDITAGMESPGKPTDEQRFQGEPDMPKGSRGTNLVPYQGPKGGRGSINPSTGAVYYGLANKKMDALQKAIKLRKMTWAPRGPCRCEQCLGEFRPIR